MQLRSPTEKAFPPCPCPNQLVDANHHMLPGPSYTETEKEEADCYSTKKKDLASQPRFSQTPLMEGE